MGKKFVRRAADAALLTGAVVSVGAVTTKKAKAAVASGQTSGASKQAAADQAKKQLDQAQAAADQADQTAQQTQSHYEQAQNAYQQAQAAAGTSNMQQVGQAVKNDQDAINQAQGQAAAADQAAKNASEQNDESRSEAQQAHQQSQAANRQAADKKQAWQSVQNDLKNSPAGKAQQAYDEAKTNAQKTGQDLAAAQKANNEAKSESDQAEQNFNTAEDKQSQVKDQLAQAQQTKKTADQQAADAKQQADRQAANAKELDDEAKQAEQAAKNYETDDHQQEVDQAAAKADQSKDALDKAQQAAKQADDNLSAAQKNKTAADLEQQHAEARAAHPDQAIKEAQDQAAADQKAADEQAKEASDLVKDAQSKSQALKDFADPAKDQALQTADQAAQKAQTDFDNKNKQIADDQALLKQKEAALKTAQDQAAALQDKAKQAKQALADKQAEIKADQAKVDHDDQSAQNQIVLGSDFKQALQTYQDSLQGIFKQAHDKFISENNDPRTTWSDNYGNPITLEQRAKIAGEEAVLEAGQSNNSLNNSLYAALKTAGQAAFAKIYGADKYHRAYVSNKKDQDETVDLDHLSSTQLLEINEYALKLINDLRAQVGTKPLVLNQDIMGMAQDIAQGYEADKRSIEDEFLHDGRAVAKAADDYGLLHKDDDPTLTKNAHQLFEDIGGFRTNATDLIITKNADGYVNSYDSNPAPAANMDLVKQSIFYNMLGMLFNDGSSKWKDGSSNWGHTLSILGLGAAHSDAFTYQANPETKFGLSISMLPNDKTMTTHYVMVSRDHIGKNSRVSDAKDVKGISTLKQDRQQLAQDQQKLAAAQNSLPALQTASDKAAQAAQDNQNQLKQLGQAVDNLNDSIKQNQADLPTLQGKLNDAKAKQAAVHKSLQQYETDLQAKKKAAADAQAAAKAAEAKADKLAQTAAESQQAASDINGIKQSLQNAVTKAKQTVAAADQALTQAGQKKDAADKALTEAQTANAAAQNGLAAAQAALTNYQKVLNQKQADAHRVSQAADAAKASAEQLADQADALQTAAEKAFDQVDQLTKALDAAQQEDNAAKQDLHTALGKYAQTGVVLADAKWANDQAKAALQTSTENLQSYQAELQTKNQQIQQAKQAYEQAQQQANNLADQAKAADQRAGQAAKNLQTAEAAQTAAKNKLVQAQSDLQRDQKQWTDLQTAASKLAIAKSALDAAKAANAQAQAQKQAAHQALKAAQSAYEQAKADLDNSSQSSSQTDAEAYGAKVVIAETDIKLGDQVPSPRLANPLTVLASGDAQFVLADNQLPALPFGTKAVWADPSQLAADADQVGSHFENVLVTFPDGSTLMTIGRLQVAAKSNENEAPDQLDPAWLSLLSLGDQETSALQDQQEVKIPIAIGQIPAQNNEIALLDQFGRPTGQFIQADSSWKIFAVKVINHQLCFRLGTEEQWVPAAYFLKSFEQPLTGVAHVPMIHGRANWQVALLDSQGHPTGRYIPTQSNWKVWAIKTVNGRQLIRIGTEWQWIPLDYVSSLE